MARGMALALVGLTLLAAPAWADHAGPLAGQWHLDSDVPGESGEDTPDSSGHRLTASAGKITLADGGRFDAHLSQEHNETVLAGSHALLRPAQVTLIAWVRQDGVPPSLAYIAGQGDDGATCLGSSYALYTGTDESPGLRFYTRMVGGATAFSPTAPATVWDGAWHMVAGVFDGSAVRLYVDGAQVGAAVPAGAINYGFSGSNFYFGAYPVEACSRFPGEGDFPGGIDEVRVYRRGLTATEIARLAAHPGPDPPVLVPDAPPTPPAAVPPRRKTLADLPAPVIGRVTNVSPVSGRVLVGIPTRSGASRGARAAQKGVRFVPLTEARQVPLGSFLDTRRGRVRLQSARDSRGTRQTSDFSLGLFQVLQSRRAKARGLTEVRLKGASFRSCAARGKRATAALSRRRIRRLRGSGRGRFRTRGRYSSATVRGTIWTVADRCDGTVTKVRRGRVAVRDFRRRKTISLRAGKSYLARNPRGR